MIQVIVSILALIAATSIAYLLTIIDSIVHVELYRFGLQFSYDWANPYWMLLRISLALLGLIAAAASMNLTYFIWKKTRKPETAIIAKEETKAEVALQEAAPSLFRCTSCGRSITHPLRMLDFNSQRPKMINVCPFCNAGVVPVNYTRAQKEANHYDWEEQEV